VHGKLTGSVYDSEDGQTGYQYDIEYGDVVISYRPWSEPGVARAQQGLLKFKIANWDGSDTTQLDEVLNTMRSMGLNLSEASEESLQLFYWRHLYGVLEDRADRHNSKWGKVSASIKKAQNANPNMTPAQELEAWKTAWGTAIGKDKVDAADWMPKFSRFNPHVTNENPEFTSGHPYWLRPDATLEDVKEAWGSKLGLSAVGNHHNMGDIVLSGAVLSTEERIRVLGQWVAGMSSSADQNKGSSNFVFTRQNLSLGSGHVFYHPKVALRTSNYTFPGDHYGEINDRKTDSHFELSKALSHAGGGNEMMIKNGLSFLDDIAVVVFPDSEQRDKVIKRFKELGITKLHGLPIEDVLLTYSYSQTTKVQQAIDKVWAQALKEAKE